MAAVTAIGRWTRRRGRVGWLLDSGEVFADFAVYKESAGQPGAIFSAAYRNDPTSTRNPLNNPR